MGIGTKDEIRVWNGLFNYCSRMDVRDGNGG